MDVTAVVFVAGFSLSGFLLLAAAVKKLLYICKPNEVLIFSGRNHRLADGSKRGYRVIYRRC